MASSRRAVLPAPDFREHLSGTLRLRSGVTLSLDSGATLLGSQDDADYPTLSPPTNNTQLANCRKALLYAESAHDIRIAGAGVIDGNGGKPSWQGPAAQNPESKRPMAIFTALSRNVTIEGVTVKGAAMWAVVNLEVTNLTLRGITVDSTFSGTRDGIDVVDGAHVLIDDVDVTSQDDSICLKSGAPMGLSDVTVRNSRVHRSLVGNGLKFGTASYGPLSNVTFDGVSVEHVDKAAMALEAVDGSQISAVTFRNITFDDVGAPVFILLGDRGDTPAGSPRRVGDVNGVSFENISGGSLRHAWGSAISGTVTPDGVDHHVKNVSFSGIDFLAPGGVAAVPASPPEYAGQYPDANMWGDLPAYGFFLRHAINVSFAGASTALASPDARQPLVQLDAANVTAR
jgi:polygalacturonase